MSEPKPRQMMTCPYNPAHQVEHYRMDTHLTKCRKSYPNCSKVPCPFDVTHVINDTEIDYHISICPKRIMLDSQKYVMDDEYRPRVEVVHNQVPVSTDENWDDDNATSYKPDPAKMGSHIIKKVKGATPSERRKARMEAIKTYKPPSSEN